jgi:hypothetical protein
MDRKQMATSISAIAAEIAKTSGVSEPDIFRHCDYGALARLSCRDLPRLAGALLGDKSVDASDVLRNVAISVEANRSTFAWLAPTFSSGPQDLMAPGGGALLSAAMDMVAKDAGLERDDLLTPKPGIADSVMFAAARQKMAMGRG